jgi:GxxExxY protein
MPKDNLVDERLTGSIIGAFFDVYNTLGHGFLENIYCNALEWELRERGHTVAREVRVTVRYKHLEVGLLRLDMLVDDELILEVKSTPQLLGDPARQLQNYLRGTDLKVGLILHFGREAHVERVVNSRPPRTHVVP